MVAKKTDEIQKCTNIDLSKIPHCKMSFIPHCRRVNYRVAQFKYAYLNYLQTPHAKGHGWIPTNKNEQVLETVWSEGPRLNVKFGINVPRNASRPNQGRHQKVKVYIRRPGSIPWW